MKLNQLVWPLINVAVVVASLAAAILFFMPVHFQCRLGEPSKVGLRIDWTNLICKIPDPNLNVSDEQTKEFWRLPNTVQLTERMTKIARCNVAVWKYNARSARKIDRSVCYCTDIWWVPLMAAVALTNAFLSITDPITWSVMQKRRQNFSAVELRSRCRWELMRCVTCVGATFVHVFNSANDLAYTNFGDIFQSEYFDVRPIYWRAAFWLFFASAVAVTMQFYAVIICGTPISPPTQSIAEKKHPMPNPQCRTKTVSEIIKKRGPIPVQMKNVVASIKKSPPLEGYASLNLWSPPPSVSNKAEFADKPKLETSPPDQLKSMNEDKKGPAPIPFVEPPSQGCPSLHLSSPPRFTAKKVEFGDELKSRLMLLSLAESDSDPSIIVSSKSLMEEEGKEKPKMLEGNNEKREIRSIFAQAAMEGKGEKKAA